jgi:HEXXH motif-containing protein
MNGQPRQSSMRLAGDAEDIRRSLRWGRLAEPQADLYDSHAILALAGKTTSAARPQPYVRSNAFAKLRVGPVFTVDELPTGTAELYSDAAPDHPSIAAGIELLRCWPDAINQVRMLIESLHPVVDRFHPTVLPPTSIISSSHSSEQRFGAVWAAVNSAVGLAQSLVHELAHHKLRALGVSSEGAIAVVANDNASRYRSPLVTWPRPMTAVLHAHYALLHVAALDCALLARERSPALRAALSRSLSRHLDLMTQSALVIRKHLIVDAFGVSFMESMWNWMDRVKQIARRHVH